MSRKLLNAYYNLEEGKLDSLLEEVKEQYINNYLKGGFSGWTHKITLCEDGDLFLSGAISQGGMLISTYEGTSMTLASIDAKYENDFQFDDYCIDFLTDEEKERLFKEVMEEISLDEEEFNGIYDNIYDLLNAKSNYYIDIEMKFKELFKDKYDKLIYEEIECRWDNYMRDRIIDDIYINIEQLKEIVKDEEDII